MTTKEVTAAQQCICVITSIQWGFVTMPILLKGLFLESLICYSTWQQSHLT